MSTWFIIVVNCSQIFCTFAVETTFQCRQCRMCSCELLSNFLYFCSRNNILFNWNEAWRLWIALKFFVLLQSKQHNISFPLLCTGCELLSNFLYFCSRNNELTSSENSPNVVNCSQIFCTFAVETTIYETNHHDKQLWIALKFFVLLQSKQLWGG